MEGSTEYAHLYPPPSGPADFSPFMPLLRACFPLTHQQPLHIQGYIPWHVLIQRAKVSFVSTVIMSVLGTIDSPVPSSAPGSETSVECLTE